MFWHLKICKFLWYDKFSKSEVASPLKLRFTDSKGWCYTSIKAKGYINKLGLFRRLFKTMWGCFYYFFFLFIFFHSFHFFLFTFICLWIGYLLIRLVAGTEFFSFLGSKEFRREIYINSCQQLATCLSVA